MTLFLTPSFGGCISARSQDTNLPLPPPSPQHRTPSTNALQPSTTIVVWFSAELFLPWGTKPTFLCRLLTVWSLRLNLRHPCALPRFRIIRRSGRSVRGHEMWVFVLIAVFLVAKITLNHLTHPLAALPHRRVAKYFPWPDEFAAFGLLKVWRAEEGSFLWVNTCCLSSFFVKFNNSPQHHSTLQTR